VKTFLTQPIVFPCWAVLFLMASVAFDAIAEDGWRGIAVMAVAFVVARSVVVWHRRRGQRTA
jgi:hypothetical protein